jgi:hypothetical protein
MVLSWSVRIAAVTAPGLVVWAPAALQCCC